MKNSFQSAEANISLIFGWVIQLQYVQGILSHLVTRARLFDS